MVGSSSSSAQVSDQGKLINEKSIQEKFVADRMPGRPQSGWQAHQSQVARQLAPSCELAGSELDTVDADLWARLKLNYERYCYKQAEVLIRRQLQGLAAIHRPPAVDATSNSTRRRSLDALKLLALAVTGASAAGSSAVMEETAPAPIVGTTATGNFAEMISSGGLVSAPSSKDARFYLERGIASYRNDDLPAAMADFDITIQLDPSLEDAYIDRGISLYRMRELNRAFDDIAQAVRIENSHRACESSAPDGIALIK